ncbi:MAG: anti-sigma F factor [Ruminococcaceae bacterium]|nr:anti-sigma F factor [Oscillospiraceae bacterium]
MKKEKINEMDLAFPAYSRNEGFARQAVCAFLAQLDPTLEELADLRTALSEAVTNCVVHAYKDSGGGKVYINVKLYSDRSIRMCIKDKGCGMAEPEKCMEPLYTTDQSGERGGMGFAIMQCFSDSLKLKTTPGKGTAVTLIKKLSEGNR